MAKLINKYIYIYTDTHYYSSSTILSFFANKRTKTKGTSNHTHSQELELSKSRNIVWNTIKDTIKNSKYLKKKKISFFLTVIVLF